MPVLLLPAAEYQETRQTPEQTDADAPCWDGSPLSPHAHTQRTDQPPETPHPAASHDTCVASSTVESQTACAPHKRPVGSGRLADIAPPTETSPLTYVRLAHGRVLWSVQK